MPKPVTSKEAGRGVALRGAVVACEIASGLGVKNIALTITHDGNTALALVIFEG